MYRIHLHCGNTLQWLNWQNLKTTLLVFFAWLRYISFYCGIVMMSNCLWFVCWFRFYAIWLQSPDGFTVASVAADETLRLWKIFETSEDAKPVFKTVNTGMFNSFSHIRWGMLNCTPHRLYVVNRRILKGYRKYVCSDRTFENKFTIDEYSLLVLFIR